jgi:hypothetical protein
VSHGEPEMNRMLRRGVLPFVRSPFGVVTVRGAMLMAMEKIKVMKKQKRSKRIGVTGKMILVARAGFEIQMEGACLNPLKWCITFVWHKKSKVPYLESIKLPHFDNCSFKIKCTMYSTT